MNYNIPYYSMMPISNMASMPIRGASGGLFSRLFKGFNIGSLLNNTQKTLNLVNQTIPIVKEINPLVKNAKTMFRVMNEFKKVDDVTPTNVQKENTNINQTESLQVVEKNSQKSFDMSDGPVFFVN